MIIRCARERCLSVMGVLCLAGGSLLGQPGAAGSEDKNTLQEHLERYLDDVSSAYRKYRSKEKRKVRKELLLAAKKRFTSARKKAEQNSLKVSRHFDDFLDNIDLARVKFRGIGDERAMISWIQEAARVFMMQLKDAKDLSTQHSGQRWFETFTEMMTRLRIRCRFSSQLARSVYSIIGQGYSLVLKKTKINKNPYGTPAERYAKNLRYVRSKFPVKTTEQKKQNASILRMLERNAQLLFRMESDAD